MVYRFELVTEHLLIYAVSLLGFTRCRPSQHPAIVSTNSSLVLVPSRQLAHNQSNYFIGTPLYFFFFVVDIDCWIFFPPFRAHICDFFSDGFTMAADTTSSKLLVAFYPCGAMHSAVFAIATCPSVCPSHASIVPSRAKAGSWIVGPTPSASPMILLSGTLWPVEKFARGNLPKERAN